jgi:hypothetical protein
MSREDAERKVDAIFEDLRDRRLLKWLFSDDPEGMGALWKYQDGRDQYALDLSVQGEIRDAWIAILMTA